MYKVHSEYASMYHNVLRWCIVYS